MLFWEPTWLLLIPVIIFSAWAQMNVSATFTAASKIRSARGYTGKDTAEAILSSEGIHGIAVEPIQGNLTDHYDPQQHVVRLSAPVYSQTSLAAMGVAAHEAGHALQHAQGYGTNGRTVFYSSGCPSRFICGVAAVLFGISVSAAAVDGYRHSDISRNCTILYRYPAG